MAFLRKKRVKFSVELEVLKLTDVSLLNAVVFAKLFKVRLLDCGSFEGFTWHSPLHANQVDFMRPPSRNRTIPVTVYQSPSKAVASPANGQPQQLLPQNDEVSEVENPTATTDVEENPQPFRFQCQIPFDERTGELEKCQLKISMRKEERGSRPQRLGFVVLNLSEFAASGSEGMVQSHLLDGYSREGGRQRQDNSRVVVRVRMKHQANDPMYKVPNNTLLLNAQEEAQLNPMDRKAPSAAPSTTTASTTAPAADQQPPTSAVAAHKLSTGSIPAATATAGELKGKGESESLTSNSVQSIAKSAAAEPTAATTTPSHRPSSLNQPPPPVTSERASWHAGTPPSSITATGLQSSSTATSIASSVLTSSTATSGAAAATTSTPISTSSVIINPPQSSSPLPPHSRRMSEDRLAALLTGGCASSSIAGGGGGGGMNASSSLANRVQKTRRDAEGVIEEVLAETSALLAPAATHHTGVEDEADLLLSQSPKGLALYVSKDGNTAVVDGHLPTSMMMAREGADLVVVVAGGNEAMSMNEDTNEEENVPMDTTTTGIQEGMDQVEGSVGGSYGRQKGRKKWDRLDRMIRSDEGGGGVG